MTSVLIVDDSQLMRNIVGGIIKEEGYDLRMAADGEKALDMLRADPPDCLVLDLMMPVMDGTDVLACIEREGIAVPTIVMTADIQESTRRQCNELGAVAILNKPPKKDELRQAVRAAVTASEEARQ